MQTQQDSNQSMSGKTVLVTGANSGIGYETAKALAGKGACVVLACRNTESAQKAVDGIRQVHAAASLDLMHLDLASLQSVCAFAEKFKQSHNELHVLVNNAGLYSTAGRKETTDGFELVMGTNHFGPFTLTLLLLDVLKQTPHSRIVMVSSESHKIHQLDFNDLNFSRNYPWEFRVYGTSKLANIFFARELHRRFFEAFGISTVSLHPGTVQTGIFTALPRWQKALLKTPERGAATSIYLASCSDSEAAANSGKYFEKCRVRSESADACNPETARRLWTASKQLVNEKLTKLGLAPLADDDETTDKIAKQEKPTQDEGATKAKEREAEDGNKLANGELQAKNDADQEAAAVESSAEMTAVGLTVADAEVPTIPSGVEANETQLQSEPSEGIGGAKNSDVQPVEAATVPAAPQHTDDAPHISDHP